ncbi:hypothetical protein JHK82_020415 [Glycine max]|nr:hypothetical protein JHK82_020415 [Glycine max]
MHGLNSHYSWNIVMNSPPDDNSSEPTELGSPDASSNENGNFLSCYGEVEAKHRLLLVQWLTCLVPSLNLPINVTDGELRACLSNGTVLCQILNKIRHGTVIVVSEPDNFLPSQSENVKTFLKALDGMGLPRFEISDLEKGSMKAVVDCLLTLREKSLQNALGDNISVTNSNIVSPHGNTPLSFHCSPTFGGEQRKIAAGSMLQRVKSSPVMAESSASLIHHVGHNFHEVFQMKPGSYADLPAAKIAEMMKSNSIDGEKIKEKVKKVDENEVVRLIKEQEDKNLEISALKVELETAKRTYEVQFSQMEEEANSFKAALTRKVQEYEHQLEELRNEAEKINEEVKTTDEEESIKFMKEQEDKKLEISSLKQELKTTKKTYEVQCSQLEEDAKDAKAELTQKAQEYENQLEALGNKVEKIKEEVKTADEKEIVRLMKEQEDKNLEISALKQELETTKRTYEVQCSQLETQAKDAKAELTQKSQEYEQRLEELRNKVEEIREEEKKADEKEIIRLMKEQEDKNLEISSLKQDLEATKKTNEVQCSQLEGEAKGAKAELEQKSQEYEHQLEELRNKVKELEVSSDSKDQKWNMKMNQMQTVIKFQFSSLQKLKLSWESIKHNVMKEQTVYAEDCDRLGVYLKPLLHAAENYHAVLAENRKMFNEIQELKGNIRVFCRIRPFLSGKKDKQSIVELIGENDLVVANPSKEGKDALRSFKFNKVFGSATTQAEVYSDIQSFIRSVLDGYNVCIFAYGQTGSGKTYTMTGPNGATSETIGVNYRALNDLFKIATSRESFIDYEIGVQMGLAVPDASLFPVKSPSDVIKLMDIGLKNRAIGATAMNERSSRSHSVLSIHICGKDLKIGSTMVGNLHLVDLAGSERVDRSEVIGDRLKEAQHINKSLSALGDVIFALSQKSPHVPYRNSKLTQLLQTSLGGQAKTLMFVQINSDISSYSETLSTLKFAERVSGVELGAARSSKESKEVRELMEQVSSLKNAISAKEEEIQRLQLLKGSVGSIVWRNQIPRSRSIKHYEADNQQPMDDHIHQSESLHQSELNGGNIGKKVAANAETSGFTDSDFDGKSSDLSDSSVAPGTETDGSENSSLTEGKKSSDKRSKAIRKTVQVMRKLSRTSSTATTPVKDDPVKKSPGIKKSVSIGNLKPPKLWK